MTAALEELILAVKLWAVADLATDPDEHDMQSLRRRIAAQPQQAVAGWRPIESAPRDGTPILVGHAQRVIAPVYWLTDQDAGVPGWYLWPPNVRLQWKPTHWMPLPTPPLASAPAAPEGAE